jgi:hypothetical protein
MKNGELMKYEIKANCQIAQETTPALVGISLLPVFTESGLGTGHY